MHLTTHLVLLCENTFPFSVLKIDWDMIFADDEKKANPAGFKFLQMAHAWKQNQVIGGAGAVSLPSLPGFVKPASAMPYNGDGGRSEKGSDESEDEE